MKSFHLAFLLLCGLCYGCVHSTAPKNDADFAGAASIQTFEGCYQNLGEGEEDKFPRHLSAVIWPEVKIDHNIVKVIRVVAISDKTLRVTAEAEGMILHEALFVEGKDFHLNSGRIKVKETPLVSLAYPAGNVFIGIGYSSQEMGIDKNDDGKLQEAGTFVGTAFIVIPIAGQVRHSFRFRKARELCNGS